MVWGTSLTFSHPPNRNLVECLKSPIVVGSDWMDLQWAKFNLDNKEMPPMVWGSSLRFWHCCNNNSVKCFKSPIVAGNDSMDL
jgi:hypothetical protein